MTLTNEEKRRNLIKTIREKRLSVEACEFCRVNNLNEARLEALQTFLRNCYREGFRASSQSAYGDF